MNAKERYHGKIPALLIVPNTGTTKKGWIARLKANFADSHRYIFRVITSDSNVRHQINKLSSPFNNVVCLNNPLKDYTTVLRKMNEKGLHGFGLHLFRSRRKRISLHQCDWKNWDQVIKSKLQKD